MNFKLLKAAAAFLGLITLATPAFAQDKNDAPKTTETDPIKAFVEDNGPRSRVKKCVAEAFNRIKLDKSGLVFDKDMGELSLTTQNDKRFSDPNIKGTLTGFVNGGTARIISASEKKGEPKSEIRLYLYFDTATSSYNGSNIDKKDPNDIEVMKRAAAIGEMTRQCMGVASLPAVQSTAPK